VTRLGGTVRLIDGLLPLGVDAAGGLVRVRYAAEGGPLLLEQRRVGDTIAVRLAGPPTIGPDSLARLLARVR
jgi:hypothetical protein